jgi:TolB-like protein
VSVIKRMWATLACVAAAVAGPAASATQAGQAQAGTEGTVTVESIAVLPWNYVDGTEGARKTAKDFLTDILVKVKVDRISDVKTVAAWQEMNQTEFVPSKQMPTAAQMLRVGQKLGVDWVMAGSAAWHSRSVWVSLGPKTKSTCTVTVRIVDVKRQEVALDVAELKMDSTAKEDTLKALGTVFISGLFTMVSGGPKTPHEQRAASLGIAKALEPWLAQHLKAIKIDPNKK